MVAAGETVTGVPLIDPGIQLYVVAPDADIEDKFPEQIDVVEQDAETVGEVFTVMSCVAVPAQPALVPVTV